MFKWLTITIIVLTGFLVVLLSLGYLLKENEVAATALKNKLDSKALIKQQKQQQIKYQRQQQFLDKNLSAKQKSQQQIIASHLSCQTSKQCLVVDTQSKALGCSVAINTLGAAILLKVAATGTQTSQSTIRDDDRYCAQVSTSPSAVCENSVCLLK